MSLKHSLSLRTAAVDPAVKGRGRRGQLDELQILPPNRLASETHRFKGPLSSLFLALELFRPFNASKALPSAPCTAASHRKVVLRTMASSSQAPYAPVPTGEREDVVETRKAMRTNDGEKLSSNGALSIMCYCLASILMTVVNKFVVSGKDFNMNCLILAIQSFVGVASVWLAKKVGIISFRDFDVADAKRWFPVSLGLATVIYTGSKSLQYLSIPIYTIFKNLTIILIAYGEKIWFNGRVTGLMMVSFALMVFSSLIAAASDPARATAWGGFDPYAGQTYERMTQIMHNLDAGYLWMLLNCLASATYVLSMRNRIKSMGFSDWDSMFYNNLLSIPILIVASFVVEDWGTQNLNLNFPEESRYLLLSAIAFSGAAAVGISYTTAWCIRVTSSTTYSMTGALNKLPVAASGMIFFHDPATMGSVSAVGTGFVAGVVYAIARQNQSRQERARQAEGTIPLHNMRK